MERGELDLPELRKDLITGEWVIIATERAKRPDKFKGTPSGANIKTSTESCPFCYGNESMTPKEVFTICSSRQRKPNTKGWQVRVVPNKFPALLSNLPLESSKVGIYDVMNGFGVHEVIIVSPKHIHSIAELKLGEFELMVNSYVNRMRSLRNDERIKSIIIMHNQGKEAGASLDHIHSQLFALPLIPPVLGKELSGTLGYFNSNNSCAMCDILKFESREDKRVVFEDKNFMVIEPFASSSPYETWIVPKKHSPSFESLEAEEISSFSYCLEVVMDFFYSDLNNPPFNYYIHTSPTFIDTSKYFHWHLELFPKLTIKAGFEMGTGVNINITRPEFTAEFMKEKLKRLKVKV